MPAGWHPDLLNNGDAQGANGDIKPFQTPLPPPASIPASEESAENPRTRWNAPPAAKMRAPAQIGVKQRGESFRTKVTGSPDAIRTSIQSDLKDLRDLRWRPRLRISSAWVAETC